MIICLGPVCVPIWPLLFLALKPLWNLIPEAQQKALKALWNDTIYPRLIEPWFSRLPQVVQDILTFGMKKKTCTKKSDPEMTETLASEAIPPGDVAPVVSVAHWNTLREDTEKLLFVDFTATWCGPCQKIKPRYCALAQSNPKHRFVTVDIDELEDIAMGNDVAAIPAFHVFRGTTRVDSITGVTEESLEEFVAKNVQ